MLWNNLKQFFGDLVGVLWEKSVDYSQISILKFTTLKQYQQIIPERNNKTPVELRLTVAIPFCSEYG